jgi:hypothetical protein
MQRRYSMALQHPRETILLSRIRFLSDPNLSNQMMLYSKQGIVRQLTTEKATPTFFDHLLLSSVRFLKKSEVLIANFDLNAV